MAGFFDDLIKLNDKSSLLDNKNDYFLLEINDLNPGYVYPIELRWKYKDGTYGKNWSATYEIITSSESIPGSPNVIANGDTPGMITISWDGKDSNLTDQSTFIKQVDIYISGSPFDQFKPALSFDKAGTKTISAPAGTYMITAYALTTRGTVSTLKSIPSITVTDIVEVIESPTNPNGFSINRILGGIEVNWAGTYSNNTFSGFKAIKIYVGNSSSATAGTYKLGGVMTANDVKNTIVIPVDGTYLRYDLPVYIHAAALNKNDLEGTLQVNVANNSLGAKTATSSDLADLIITNAKLVDDAVTAAKIATSAITPIKIDAAAVTEAKIATSAITETKIATDSVTSAKIVAGAVLAGKIATGAVTADKIDASAVTADKIAANAVTADKIIANAVTADKIVSSAITADKIATNAITAGKILAGEIDVTKLAAGTISVNNLESGTIKSTSYIRAGSNTGGARIEMSTANISGGPSAGFYIYDSNGTAILSAPLTGGLTITGNGTFTGNLSAGSGNSIFKSDSNGIYLGNAVFASAPFSVDRSGVIKAEAGKVGGLTLASDSISNSAGTFQIGSTGQLLLGSSSGTNKNLLITPTQIVHRSGTTATGAFTLDLATGNLSINSATITGYATQSSLDSTNTTVAGKVAAADVYKHIGGTNTTTISGGVITTGTINLSNVNVSTAASGSRLEITSTGLKAYSGATNTVAINSDGTAIFKGDITGASGTFGGVTLDSTGLSSTQFSINSSGNATFSGSLSAATGTFGGTVKVGTPSNYTTISTNTYGQGSIDFVYGANTGYIYYSSAGALYNVVGSGSTVLDSISYQVSAATIYLSGNKEFSGGTNSFFNDVNLNSTSDFRVPYAYSTTTTNAATVWISSTGQLRRYSPSSERYKTNIIDISEVPELNPELLYLLPVRAFKYKDGIIPESDDRYNMLIPGFIAEEVDSIYPQAVDYENGQPETWNHRTLIPGMLALIQDQNNKIKELSARLDALEA